MMACRSGTFHPARFLSVGACLFLTTSALLCAEDQIERKGTGGTLRGQIVGITRTEVTLKPVNKSEVKIPANEITRVRFDGEKPQINILRADEAAGHYRKALDGFADALRDAPASQKNLRTDLEFLIARSTAKLAAEDPKLTSEALKKLEDFNRSHPENFRYYEVTMLLGQLHLARNNLDAARSAFQTTLQAPWEDYRIAARNAGAKLLLVEGKTDDALREYEAVFKATESAAGPLSGKYEALLGKAACLEKKGDVTQATQVLEQLLENAAEDDTAIQAEASVRLGNAFQSGGKLREAILAYLRVDVLFPKEARWRAEALYALAQLWGRDGKPDRAASAATTLQTEYPESEWAKKLAIVPSP